MLEVLEILELSGVTCCALLRMLEAVEIGLCLPKVPVMFEVICCVLHCMLEVVEGRLCSLEVLGCRR